MAFTSRVYDLRRIDGQTTNATATTLMTIPLPTAGNIALQAFVVARDSAGNSKSFNLNAGAKSVANVATVLGAVVSLLSVGDVGAALWGATVTASGGDIVVQVTGAAATTIDWSAYVTTYQTA